jgi:hypothetical protein
MRYDCGVHVVATLAARSTLSVALSSLGCCVRQGCIAHAVRRFHRCRKVRENLGADLLTAITRPNASTGHQLIAGHCLDFVQHPVNLVPQALGLAEVHGAVYTSLKISGASTLAHQAHAPHLIGPALRLGQRSDLRGLKVERYRGLLAVANGGHEHQEGLTDVNFGFVQ